MKELLTFLPVYLFFIAGAIYLAYLALHNGGAYGLYWFVVFVILVLLKEFHASLKRPL